ncbi:MAG: ABC transporter substrate-binding protein [Desulfobacterales bacterium]|nr:MAG: ABC transporter substrate-binding protein [Desulfobacterales bacterium]
MKILSYAVLSVLILSQSVMADDKIAAEKLLKSKLNAAITVLQKKNAALQVKSNEIDEIMSPMFDFSLMAKLTLGRKYWPKLTTQNKEKFTELFTELLKSSYLQKLTLYTNEKIMYKSPILSKKKIQIPTYLISLDKKTSILYKLYKSENDWKIYDIEIQGVSLIRSYRSQFIQILQTGTIEDLLLKLENSVANQ